MYHFTFLMIFLLTDQILTGQTPNPICTTAWKNYILGPPNVWFSCI